MKQTFEIKAQLRSKTGRGASRRLRKQGQVPAIVYGGTAPTMTSLNHNELSKHLEFPAFYSHILQLNLDGVVESVVLKDLQRHPARPVILHADFQRISADKHIRMLVPLRFVNEDKCPGLKKGGTITRSITEIEIDCLPKDLPEFITVDVGALEMGHSVHVAELVLPTGVILTHALDTKAPVASVHGTRGTADAEVDAAAKAAETAAAATPAAAPAKAAAPTKGAAPAKGAATTKAPAKAATPAKSSKPSSK